MERQIIRYQGELWSEIPGHHGKYFASRNGQILSLAKSQSKPRVLRQIRDGEYLHVFLRRAMLGIKWGYLEERLR